MKKLLSKIIVSMLILSLVLMGCGSNSADNGASNADAKTQQEKTAPQANEQPKESEQVVLRYWDTVNDADPNDYMNKWANENIKLFQEQNPNIKIEFTNTTNGDQYLNKISTEMAANNVPDLFMTWVAGRLEPFVKAGRLAAMNDIINNNTVLKNAFNEGNLSSTTFDGKVYAVPNEASGEIVYYNKELFTANSLEVPKTWDELLNAVKVFKGKGITPFALANKDPWLGTIPYMMIFDRINGPEEYEKTAFNKEKVFDTESYVKTGQYLYQLVEAGAYPKNFNSLEGGEGLEMFKAGKAAMIVSGAWDAPGFIEALGDKLGVFNWVDMPENKGKSTEDYLVTYNRAYAIGESSENKEAAAKFLEFMFSNDRQKILAESGYMIAAQNIDFDKNKLHPVASELSSAFSSAKHPILIWDVMLGQNIGKELNLATQAMLGGADIQKTLERLNTIAKSEWN